MSTPQRAPYEGMSLEVYRRIDKLPADMRHRVLERAAIIREACGCSWREADERALREEGPQREMQFGG